MKDLDEKMLTDEDYEMAACEASFILDIFSRTIETVMGGSISSVGRFSGRSMARKIPVFLPDPALPEVLKALGEYMRHGFAFTVEAGEKETGIFFSTCAIREVCRLRRQDPGGPICRLFHSYFDGMINELNFRPAKSRILRAGDTCSIMLEVK